MLESDSRAGDVGVVANSVKVRDGGGARGGVVAPDFNPPKGLECLEVEGQRFLDVGDRNVDVIDHDASSFHAAAILRAKSQNFTYEQYDGAGWNCSMRPRS